MQIEHLALDALIPYARNSRTHSDEQVAQVAASIREFGFTNPVLIDGDGGIIAGHGRVMAARKLGLADVPCIRLAHLTAAQKRAYIIADNKLALNAGWDDTLLALELQELQALDYDLALTGFMGDEIDQLLAELDATPEGQTDPDETPEVQADAISKPGDVWLLGKHRIMCGDSTDAGSVAMLMGGGIADAVLTDPPYGQNQEGVPGDQPQNLPSVVMAAHRLPVTDAVIVAFQSPRTFPAWLNECIKAGHRFERMLWLYKRAQNSYPWRGWLLTSEAILATSVGSAKWHDQHPYAHDCYMLAEVSGEIDSNIGWHGSVKPVSVVSDIAQRICPPGALIYEPFSGSGTTIIAAEQTGRRCYAMELSPNYVDVAVRRWQNFTGKRATLEATGAAFPDAAAVNSQK
jgi:hypothetical protein